MNVFLTGSTGFVGGALLARLARRPEVDRIYVLIRPGKDKTVAERAADLIQRLIPPDQLEDAARRIVPVAGAITSALMGLEPAAFEALAQDVQHVVHAAASTKFVAPIEQLRNDNVRGSREVLALAARCQALGHLNRFDYISTAFVAGMHSGVVTERDLNRGQQFSNSYEQTKFEAEMVVAEALKTMPGAVFRPSIIVGESHTGFTPHFRVLYWPLRLLTSKIVPIIPVSAKTTIDVVPIDYVINAVEALMFDKTTIGGTFHLTAGHGNEPNVRQFVRDTNKWFKMPWRPVVPFWAFDLVYNTMLRHLLGKTFIEKAERARPYRPYIEGHGTYFDSSATRAILAAKGVACPLWDDYKLRLLEYVRDTQWGTVNVQPDYVYYAAGR